MIDLSHLTEEEQGMILTVLKRDAELKKAEEERIRKLEEIRKSGSQADSERKYLTGEWFYEAKSRRHMDKIHGSEIILASMKQWKAGLEGSLRIERSKAPPSSRGSDIVAPPKPARCLDALQPEEINSDAEKENLNSPAPRTPRHNPFNRASLIVVDPPEYIKDLDTIQTEPISPLRSHPAAVTSQTSSSVTSEGSTPVGFRPVPKKRTFISRRTSDSSGTVSDGAHAGSPGVVPAPRRRSLQRGSSVGSNHHQPHHPRGQKEMPENSVASNRAVSQFAQPSKSLDGNSRRVPQYDSPDFQDVTGKLPHPSTAAHDLCSFRPATQSADREIPQKSDEGGNDRREPVAVNTAVNTFVARTDSFQDSDRQISSVGSAVRQEDLSLSLNAEEPDPPVAYDLHFIDDTQAPAKSNQRSAFQLSAATTSPTGEDEDSIAKVLDWFNRASDGFDWQKTEDARGLKKSADKRAEFGRKRGDDLLKEDTRDVVSERKTVETVETKMRSHPQRKTNEAEESRAAVRVEKKKEPEETQEGPKKDAGGRARMSQDVEENPDESQAAKISNLKSFWEKSNAGPKIIIGKSVTPVDKGPKPVQLSEDKEEKKVNTPHGGSDMPSVPGICNGKGGYDKYVSNHGYKAEQQLPLISSQKDSGDKVHSYDNQQVEILLLNTAAPKNKDPTDSDYLKVEDSSKVADRRALDTEVLGVTSPRLWNVIQSRLNPESENVSVVKLNPQPDSFSQYKEFPTQDELPKTVPLSTSDTDLQSRDSPYSEQLCLSRNSPYMDYKQGGDEVQITAKTQTQRGSSEEVKRRDGEEKSVQSSVALKQKEDTSNKDRVNSPRSNRHGLSHQESTERAERIKQLKSFWEQERNKPVFHKPKPLGEGKGARGANQTKMNKRFTKSEYDLTSIGNYSDSEEEDSERNRYLMNQRLDKLAPGLSTSRTQFNTLRVFWDEASSDAKVPFTSEKPKSPKRKEPIGSQLTSLELKCGDPELHRSSAAFDKTKPAVVKSSSPSQGRSKSGSQGSRAPNDVQLRSSKDFNREEKSTKPSQSGSGKEARSPKGRTNSGSRGSSMRRAISMFALSAPDEPEPGHFKADVSPVHSQSRKYRQSTEKGAGSRRSSEDTETLTPRARACVPKDYRHYLGMTDNTSVHTSLAPAVKSEPSSEGKTGYEFDMVGGPRRASTPVSSEERYSSRRGSKPSQRPLWSVHSSSDTGHESAMSSTSETWSSSRNSSTREDDQNLNAVRKALRRAEARPKNLAKSMEDITAPLSPQRRPDPTADKRRISDVSSVPSPSPSLFSDPEHLKKMSKSVPSFLQEGAGRDTDSTCDDSDHRGGLMGNSLTDLTGSPGMASVSSLSGSVMTMYSGDFGSVEVQGNIQFSINYVQRLREFHIFVAECRDLAAVDPKRGRSDPYVKSYLLPDKAHLGKRKTSVKKKTLNPIFNEILRYRVRMEYLRTQTLILSVWHHDTFGRNSFLGEVDVDLSKWDFDHTQKNYLALKTRTTPIAPSNGQGEMKLAIRFLPQIIHSEELAKEASNTGEVHIWVKECKNLPLVRAAIDPYVKCFVLPDTSRKSRQKTRVLRRTVDPAFNHTMVYDGIREADLLEACVELTVWDRDRLASNLLGGLRLGPGTGRSYGAAVDWMDSTPFEAALWERMRACPNEWVEDVLPLRMLSSAKNAFK